MSIQKVCSQLAPVLLALAVMLPQRASANMASCTEAHASGQREENAGHLKEALASFETCAADSECPLPIRNECTSLYSKVEGRLPTVVFSVVDDGGNDVTNVRVLSADAQIVSSLDGRPVAIDPGLHEFRFELPSGEVLTKSVSVRQGEKDRIVSVKLPRSEFAATAPAQSSDQVVASDSEPPRHFVMPIASWVAYGVGVAALGAWGTFALLGRGQEKDLVDCSPSCSSTRHDDYDSMKRNYLIADVSLGVAAAAVVAGTVVLLTTGRRPKSENDRATTAKRLSVTPMAMGRVGGGVLLQTRY